MTSAKRVSKAIDFKKPDRLPRWDSFDIFGNFISRWQTWKKFDESAQPIDYYNIDINMSMCNEGPFFSTSGVIGYDRGYEIFRDTWGRTVRQKPNSSYFMETLETMLSEPLRLDSLKFDDPADDRRYPEYVKKVEAERKASRLAFSKIGGIYCRSQFMRREDLLLVDMALDEGFCHALFERIADYSTQIALEELRRTDSWETGIWVYDDSANMLSPMFSPVMWEKYLLPQYARMINTLRIHGCKHFFFHSDGNIGPLIDSLIAAGFEGLNPLEPRCGLDLVKLRKRYGKKIVFFGGVCNTQIMPRGNKKEKFKLHSCNWGNNLNCAIRFSNCNNPRFC